ncbi:MAG: hypothetical protein Q8Q12_21410 [bacterium]|nr:hypothetical protein [bacterium]
MTISGGTTLSETGTGLHRDRATPAPGGTIVPPGFQRYNGMVHTATDIPLEGRKAVFLAVRPANATRLSQIELPILKGAQQ